MSKSLRVAVLGPKGQCGSCVVDELLSRGHSVVGISRTPPKTWPKSGEYGGIPCDCSDIKGFSNVQSDGDFDAVVSAFGPPLVDLKSVYSVGVEGHGNIKMAILKSTFRGPFIIIGGAGSLFYKHGVQLCDDEDFAFKHWYAWPNVHLNYMSTRMFDHGQQALGRFIRLFKWARANRENPGWFSWLSWLSRPFANWCLRSSKKNLTNPDTIGLILCSRVALTMWEGVKDRNWSFLSPPWQLRDKGIRTGKYEVHVDDSAGSAEQGIDNGIYNEDMAVAIVDEVENNKLNHKHWTCTGPIGLKEW
ncbi:uncharacterized protein N7479_006414 [Penicillium vulpinum]|uniref:NAD(P)-binding domain-containing protein n=1 Tax=Penicillium vulpinum TaxID=29845 RepID=A0A1V6S2P2_9EURO|nr:uncharacterized protein N7479_006414 [Penicillium vulpinum]KAJ5959264.1 hypothetical protein N7479_006414 [Penicillium vulpinum]OQE08014.1 hypothetical protein PENVUL_c011G03469 [Penicillium vulpinum]